MPPSTEQSELIARARALLEQGLRELNREAQSLRKALAGLERGRRSRPSAQHEPRPDPTPTKKSGRSPRS